MIIDYTTHDIRDKEKEIWIWIKHRLALLDLSFIKLARIHGVKKQNIAIVKHSPYPKYERVLANSLGIDPWELWPDRYDTTHKPNRKRVTLTNIYNRLEHNRKEINGKDRRMNCHEAQD